MIARADFAQDAALRDPGGEGGRGEEVVEAAADVALAPALSDLTAGEAPVTFVYNSETFSDSP